MLSTTVARKLALPWLAPATNLSAFISMQSLDVFVLRELAPSGTTSMLTLLVFATNWAHIVHNWQVWSAKYTMTHHTIRSISRA